ncbi:MAG: hypothetical protein GYB64_06185 [Chloroflexi bacterium]|nr:hypothetical protein [Chloroflexota bacterium]
MNTELWDALHDGHIDRVDIEAPNNLLLTLTVEALRNTLGRPEVIIRLIDCTHAEWDSWDTPRGVTSADLEEIEVVCPHILDAQAVDGSDTIKLSCDGGDLYLRYLDYEIWAGDDRVTLETISDLTRRYWENF